MFLRFFFKHIVFPVVVMVCLISHSRLIDALQERHHFFYRITVLSRAENTSDFTADAVADDRRLKHYTEDENWEGINEFKHDWTQPPPEPYQPRQWYKDLLKTVLNCTQCSELHTLQRIIGCKIEKFPNGTVMNLTVFDEYGVDGEDFMSFNDDTLEWINKSSNAKEIKKDWDSKIWRKQFVHNYLLYCMDWISTFNNTNKTSPDVHVFARKAPDDQNKLDLICLVTGFYPRDIEMNIRLDRTNLEKQISSGVRYNNDETFQMRTSVKIDRDHRGSYDCFVVHSSLTEPLSVEWDRKCFNCETRTHWQVGTAVAILVVIVVVIPLLVCCTILYNTGVKKKQSNESSAVMSNPCDYGAVNGQARMSNDQCADTTDEELSDEV